MNRAFNLARAIVFALGLFAMLSLVAGVAFGQAIDGAIVGTVQDSQGAAVVGADVTATNVATNVTYSTKTGNSGDYRFDHLLVGTYRIVTKMTGFKTSSEQVVVELNKIGTRNVTLVPGATTETVEVSGTPPTIDTTSDQLQTTYTSVQLDDMAAGASGATGGGVLNLSLLQAGVGSTGGLGAGSGPSVGGQRPRENNFTIEGTDNNDKGVTGPLVYVPNDAVENFTIIQNQFSPEFGHSAGGQFNQVVRSGSNNFHGRVYEYFQNRDLNAIDQTFANQGVTHNPRYDNNRFGGQAGGPIFKNKLFYFANYEYNPIGQSATPGAAALAPTSTGWQTILAIPGVSANNVNTFAQYATAPANDSGTVAVTDNNGNPVQIPIGVVPIVAPNFINTTALTTSMDYNISDSDQIRGRYIYNRQSFVDIGAELPVFFTSLKIPYHLVTLAEYHTFTPNIINEFRVGFNRNAQNYGVPSQSFPGLDSFPNITIDDLNQINIGPDPNAPQYSVQNTYQLQDNFSWTAGPHTLKFGADIRKQISPQLFIQRSRGDYEYNTLDEYVHDVVPDFGQRSFGAVGYSGDDYMIGWYVNDIWKVTRNLTLNMGVRYEYLSVPFGWTQQSLNAVADLPGLITFGTPHAPKKDFMPRIGFAYSPGTSGTTSIRGGFSMAYDVLYDNIGTLSRPPQIGSTANCPNAALCKNPFLANGGIPPQNLSGISVLDQADARANTSSLLPVNVKYPYAESWNLGIQRIFHNDYTAEVRYVGSRGVHLPAQNILDFVSGANSTPGYNVPTFINAPSAAQVAGLTTAYGSLDPTCTAAPPNNNPSCPSGDGDVIGSLLYGYDDTGTGPGGFFDSRYLNNGFFSPITSFQPWAWSTYHGLQTQLQRRFSNGFAVLGAWTWSHTIDNATADFFSTSLSPRRPQDFRNLDAEKANSFLDHAHRVTLSAVYEVPWYKGSSSWFARNVLGNYQIAPAFIWESGQWGTVQSAIDSNMNADSAPDRAIFNPAGTPGVGSDVVPVTNNTACSLPPCIVGWQAVNPNAQWIVAGQGTVANGRRNTVETPPINNFDLSVAKHLKFGERYQIDLFAQTFNALNHPQFVTGSVNNILSISSTGAPRSYFEPQSSIFQNARQNFSSNPRTMQLAVKFSW